MATSSERAAQIEAQFGRAADMYARSEHKGGRDLELLREWANPQPDQVGLDVATGAGHTALWFAPFARHVTVTDLSPGMLDKAKQMFAQAGATNADFRLADVQALPFADETFDFVTCRIAPHHFVDIDEALRQIARVLKRGGRFLLVDSVAPEDESAADFLDAIERLRDPTHVRTYSRSEWLALCEHAGLTVERVEVTRKSRDFEFWLERGSVDAEATAEVRRRFLEADPRVRREFEIAIEDGIVRSFTDDKIVLAARRP
jgi:ubiquinone/menaquinone biosynthesis C-methylase UbiE